jgi:phage replication-related protein YjqB (UPF0714/DUF867 family)
VRHPVILRPGPRADPLTPPAGAPRRWPSPPPAVEVSWAQLLAHPEVDATIELRSEIGVLAYHGGVELGTYELACLVAESSGASLYALTQPDMLRWHVPSVLVDPGEDPGLAAVLDHIRVAMSIHGYGRRDRPWDVLLGGTNRTLAATVAAALRAEIPEVVVIDDLVAIPPALRGLHPANPVNLPAEGGVQIELPLRLRRNPELRVRVAHALAGVALASSRQAP